MPRWMDLGTWILTSRELIPTVVGGRCDHGRKSERCNIAGFEDGEREPEAKECGWPLERGKGKEMNFPPEPLERNATLWTS